MIIVIITIVALILCVAWLLWGRWERHTSETIRYNSDGKSSRNFYELEDYSTVNEEKVARCYEILKRHYPEELEKWQSYYKEKYNDEHDITYWVFNQFRGKPVPCDVTTSSRVQLNDYYDISDVKNVWALVFIGINLLALVIMGACVIGAKNTWSVRSTEAKITERIVELENNQKSLLKFYETGVTKDIDISASGLPERIREHNSDVAGLLKTIKTSKIDISNPWINWFINPAYQTADVARVEAT